MGEREFCDPPARDGIFWARFKEDLIWEPAQVVTAAVGGGFHVYMMGDEALYGVSEFDWGPEIVRPAGLRDGA